MPPAVAPAARWGGRLRPSGPSVVGTSTMLKSANDALTSISLANSMPVVRRSRASIGPSVEPAQPAVEVADLDPEEAPSDRRQHRVAQVAVEPRHRAGDDATSEAVADHDLVCPPRSSARKPSRAVKS